MASLSTECADNVVFCEFLNVVKFMYNGSAYSGGIFIFGKGVTSEVWLIEGWHKVHSNIVIYPFI